MRRLLPVIYIVGTFLVCALALWAMSVDDSVRLNFHKVDMPHGVSHGIH